MSLYLKCKITRTTALKELSNLEDIPNITSIITENVKFQQNLINNEERENLIIINGRKYQKNLLVLEAETLFNRSRKLWKRLDNLIVNENPVPSKIFDDVKEVIYLVFYTAQNLTVMKETSSMNFQKEIHPFIDLLRNSIINECSKNNGHFQDKFTSNLVTLKSEPISEYFHFYLSLMYLFLHIDLYSRDDKFVKDAMCIMIKWSKNIYTKNKEAILNVEPFLCVCVKRLWLYLIHRLKKSGGTFWEIFNNSLLNNSNDEEEFTIWLLYHISILYLYNDEGLLIGVSEEIQDNYELLSKCLRNATNRKQLSENKLLNILKLSKPILNGIWISSSKLEPFQILWEYFYKTLDQSENVQVCSLKNISEMMDFITRLTNNPELLDNSYDYYLHMLSNHLKNNLGHWNKMRGRIYSRLPPQKLSSYNYKGLYRIGLLFIVLSRADVSEAIEKLYGLFETLSEDKHQKELIWIIYLVMMIINIEQHKDIKKISTIIRNQTEVVASNRENFNLLKHYISTIEVIMNLNQNYDLGQNLLLGSWLTPYMCTCSYADLCQLLDTIAGVVVRVENSGKWYEFKHCFVEYVLPGLKSISISSNAPSEVGELAAKICLNSREIIPQNLQFFCGTTVNINVTHKFLVTILRNNQFFANFSQNEENLLISSWFRLCISNADTSYKDLSELIFNLPSIKSLVSIDVSDCDNPYISFVRNLSSKMECPINISSLKDLSKICFGNVDQWLTNFLNPYTTDTQISYLYTTISMFFYLCSPLLYHKSKSTCLFNRLVTLMLLPTEILMGKPPQTNVLKGIEKTWHLFVKGVYALNTSSDPYIDRTLKDLVIRYLPHFSYNNSPMLKVLDDPKVATLVLDKISNSFLLKSSRSAEENTHKALKTIQHIINNTKEKSEIILIIDRTMLGILEVAMFSNQNALALELIKSLITSGWYEQVQLKLQEIIRIITDRHLAFNTSRYFQLIGSLINIIPSSVRMSLDHIKKQICHVEKMRGVGFDNTLRQGLDRVEKALS